MDPLPPAVFNLMEGNTDALIVLAPSHSDENEFRDGIDDDNHDVYPFSDPDEEEEPSVVVTRVVMRNILPTSNTPTTSEHASGGNHGGHVQHLCDADDDEEEEPSVEVTRVVMRKILPTSTTTTFTKHTGGRGVHKCWELLSDETGQHLVSQSKCRSCRMVVKHHKKSEKVKAHLNSCSEFRRSMADLP